MSSTINIYIYIYYIPYYIIYAIFIILYIPHYIIYIERERGEKGRMKREATFHSTFAVCVCVGGVMLPGGVNKQ